MKGQAMKINFEIFFEAMNLMAKEGLLQWMVHYNTYIDKRGVYSLRINYKDCYDRVVDYCIEKNLYYPGLTLEEFKVVLRSKNYCLCYNAPTWFNKERKSIFKKEVRGAKLDVALLQREGVEISYLLLGERR